MDLSFSAEERAWRDLWYGTLCRQASLVAVASTWTKIDVQAHYKRLFRCQLEYGRRDSDRFGILPNGPEVFSEAVFGYYAEAEARPWDKCRVSLLARYDCQKRSSQLPPSGSTLPTGTFDVERITVGINIDLWHQSLLMIDFERWLLPELGHHTADVFGIRYTITF